MLRKLHCPNKNGSLKLQINHSINSIIVLKGKVFLCLLFKKLPISTHSLESEEEFLKIIDIKIVYINIYLYKISLISVTFFKVISKMTRFYWKIKFLHVTLMYFKYVSNNLNNLRYQIFKNVFLYQCLAATISLMDVTSLRSSATSSL